MEMNQLRTYRQLGLARLEALLLLLPASPHPADFFVDQSIRDLSQLPARPVDALPYRGLYGATFSMSDYRDEATSRLLELILPQSQFGEIDEEIDRYIRLLSGLPPRPEGVAPYVRLFPLQQIAAIEYVNADQVLDMIGTVKLQKRVMTLLPSLNATLKRYQITTPLRMAHFFAQILHESGGFRFLQEIWGPTAAQKRYEPPSPLAKRLGNTQPGDGKRFKGRGVIQLTGRFNYGQFSKAVGVDFVGQPELVAAPEYAVWVAGWYWQTRNINTPADQDNLLQVTRLINGGTNGLSDRRRYLTRAKRILEV
jgi:putative chitinase